jgi:Response regulator containing a CheY-like receiver domain and an HTH DNA-binding domain
MVDLLEREVIYEKPSARKKLGAAFRGIVLPAVGFALLRFWIMLVEENAHVFSTNPGLYVTSWVARGVFPLLVVVLLNALPLTKSSVAKTMGVCTIMSVVGGLCLAVSLEVGALTTMVLSAIVGLAGTGWLYICWSEVYRWMRIRDVAISVMLSLMVSTVAAGISVLLPFGVRLALIAGIPLFTTGLFVAYLRTDFEGTHDRSSPASQYSEGQMMVANGRWFAMLAVYAFVLGAIHVISTSQEGAVQGQPYGIYLITSFVVALAFFVGVISNKLPSVKVFWLVIVGAIGFSFVTALAFNAMLQVVLSVFAGVRYVAFGYINIKLVDIARHSRTPIYVVFAAGWSILQISMGMGAVATLYGLDTLGLNLDVVVSMLLAVLAMGGLLLPHSSELSDVFVGASQSDEADERNESASMEGILLNRCRTLRQRFGLTEREAEIVFLIAQGYTQTYCAEALMVSINTIRSHMKHIYSKLDIHSKDELLQLLNGQDGQAVTNTLGAVAEPKALQ